MLQKWTRLSSKIVLDHPRLKVIEDAVRLPNGKVTDYLKFENKGQVATIICRDHQGKFLLQQEYSYPPDEILYQFPGGHIPEGEDIQVGANRELMEEAKLRANKLTFLGGFLINNRRSSTYCHIFLATDLVEASEPEDEEEFIDSFWFSETKINSLIKNDKIKNIHVLAAWALYQAKK